MIAERVNAQVKFEFNFGEFSHKDVSRMEKQAEEFIRDHQLEIPEFFQNSAIQWKGKFHMLTSYLTKFYPDRDEMFMWAKILIENLEERHYKAHNLDLQILEKFKGPVVFNEVNEKDLKAYGWDLRPITREMLGMLLDGKTIEQVAQQYKLPPSTVKKYCNSGVNIIREAKERRKEDQQNILQTTRDEFLITLNAVVPEAYQLVKSVGITREVLEMASLQLFRRKNLKGTYREQRQLVSWVRRALDIIDEFKAVDFKLSA